MAGFFRGTSHEQDARFQNKHNKLMSSMKFPPQYSLKVSKSSSEICVSALIYSSVFMLAPLLQVDMSKVKLDVIKNWIGPKIHELLGMEDDVVVGLCFNLLEEKGPVCRRTTRQHSIIHRCNSASSVAGSSWIFSCVCLLQLDPRNIQIQLTGFLERKAKVFVAELWELLHSASENPSGIPTIMLEQKKKELLAKKVILEKQYPDIRKSNQTRKSVVQVP